MKIKNNFLFGFLVFLSFFIFVNPCNAQIFASTDKIVYTLNDTIKIGGIVNIVSPVNITATIYNSSDVAINSSTVLSSGGELNIFSISNVINGSYTQGSYYVVVTDGTNSTNINFEVVTELFLLEAHLIETSQVIPVNTSSLVTGDYNYSGNFSELRALSQNTNKILHYGSQTVNSTLYYFVLVDQNYPSIYDTLYIDDDNIFQLYNDTEDNATYPEIEKVRKVGEKFGNYLVGEIEFATGNKVFLGLPVNDSVYNPNETVYFVVLVKNSTHYLKQDSSVTINASLVDKDDNVLSSFLNNTNTWGYFASNFTAPSTPGVYLIMLNNTPAEIFFVETFKLFGKITDLADSPTYSFAPNPIVRISATVKTSAGVPIDGASVAAIINYPNGSTQTVSLTGANGTYSNDVNLQDAPTGEYGVRINATHAGDTQEFSTGFAIEIVSLEVIAINPEFIEEAEGPEAMVSAFAPNSNVSLMVVLSNISAGGIMAKGPEGAGLVDIDNASTAADECSQRVTLMNLKDDRGVSLNLTPLNVQAMNLSNAMTIFGAPPGEGPPEQMLRQCMIIFSAPNRTGVYKADVKVTHPLGEKMSGASFGVQRLYATANPVDFKGEDFWFYAPNTTIRIKLKVMDLSTREDVSAENITDAKIIEMFKEWPTFEDVFTPAYRATANESVTNGTISFISPNSEGFFFMKFKFKANLNGSIEEGVGNGFFMLKKYMIWGEPYGCQPGQPCMIGVGKNVTLTVYAVDIDKGSLLDLKQTGLTCTGCDGLEVDVEELWNDQLMKKMEKDVDYKVTTGSIINSTANVTIVVNSSKPLPSGWYHVDLILTDLTDPNKTYFGWAGFEIRNFWVDLMPVSVKNGNLTASWGKGTYGIGQPVTFAVAAWDPTQMGTFGPQPLDISSVSLEGINRMVHGPPIALQEGKDYNYTTSKNNISVEFGPVGMQIEMWVVNITGLSKSGNYQANVRATTTKGSDVGSGWFDLSSYLVQMVYRGMEEWPPTFAPTENFTVNVSAYNFDGSPRNLSQSGTKIKSLWNEKTGRPIKINSSTTCPQVNNCTLTTDLSQVGSGRYYASIVINDTTGMIKEDGVFFVVKGLTIAIPVIRDVWVDHLTDTPDRELNVDNDRDRCDNERWLNIDAPPGNKSGTFCITQSGEWRDTFGSCDPNDLARVNVTSNGTALWITTGEFMSGLPNVTGDNFTVPGDSLHNWTIVKIGNISEGDNSFRIKHKESKICGSKWVNCGLGGCEEQGYVMTPPLNYSTFYHGYIRNLIQDENIANWFGPTFNDTRWVYVYHNTTNIWVTNGTDMSSVTPKGVGGTLTDPYGGKWKVKSISKRKVGLSGLNVLARSGAWINTSLSKSGIIKLGPIREEELGGWDPKEMKERGMDLDNDGLTNSTVYFAIADSATSGVYDTFFFSITNNLSKPIPITANRTVRTFGLNDKLTLFNIAPDGKKVMVYSNLTGDWGDLGDFKLGSNITIPILVLSPAGNYISANISIKNIRKEIGTAPPQIVQPSPVPNTTINGLGEIVVNLSYVGQTESGRYAFEITASKDGQEERMEEWRWPFVTMRAFLVDSSIGYGGYISGFKPLPLTRYDWESYGEIGRIRADRQNTSNVVEGVLTWAHPFDFAAEGCEVWNATVNITDEIFSQCSTYPLLIDTDADQVAYYFYNSTSQTLYRNATCWFNVSDTGQTTYQEGDSLIVSREGRNYNVSVLRIDIYDYTQCCSSKCWRASFGVAGVNSSVMLPMRNDTGNPEWGIEWGYMPNISIGGVSYDVILANDTIDYPMCSIQNIQECVKKAWIDTDGDKNFTNAAGVKIGENFISDLYLAKIGPGVWEGIIIGNFSQVPQKPGVDVRVRDNTVSYFGILNESVVNLDLNMDSKKNKTFYMVTFDDRDDTPDVQELTDNIVDDDLNITEEWWSDTSTPPNYKDFYNNETGMREERHGLPRGIEWGNARFGEIVEGVDWEEQPEWNIADYNNTDMLLRKWKWQFNTTENVTLIVKAYDFNQNPIVNANISVERLMQFTPFGGKLLNASAGEYSVSPESVLTNNAGYGILKLENSPWQEGEYMVQIKIVDNSGNIERVYNWFRMGPKLW